MDINSKLTVVVVVGKTAKSVQVSMREQRLFGRQVDSDKIRWLTSILAATFLHKLIQFISDILNF